MAAGSEEACRGMAKAIAKVVDFGFGESAGQMFIESD